MVNFGPFSQKTGGARAPLAPPVLTALNISERILISTSGIAEAIIVVKLLMPSCVQQGCISFRIEMPEN